MRKIRLTVGGQTLGEQRVTAYPNSGSLPTYSVPIYGLNVAGKNGTGQAVSADYQVLRFGVQSKDGKTAGVVGLADAQVHTIKQWIPTYEVHSFGSPDNGGWQVYGNFLIHDGPDNRSELFGSLGCIEVMGPKGSVTFNDLLLDLSGAIGTTRDRKLHQIARAGALSIRYDKAAGPTLKVAS